jgi:hypothetical protein
LLPFESVTYNLTVVNDRSVTVFGWVGENDGPAAEFIRSFVKLSPTSKAEAAVRLGFEHIGNSYMKPSWWFSLPEPSREAAIARLASGGSAIRRADCLKPDGFAYTANVEAVETLWI